MVKEEILLISSNNENLRLIDYSHNNKQSLNEMDKKLNSESIKKTVIEKGLVTIPDPQQYDTESVTVFPTLTEKAFTIGYDDELKLRPNADSDIDPSTNKNNKDLSSLDTLLEEKIKNEDSKYNSKFEQNISPDHEILDDIFKTFISEVESIDKDAQERIENRRRCKSTEDKIIIPVVQSKIELGTPDYQCDRLTSKTFSNPYQVLMLNLNADDNTIQSTYRKISFMIHPDKCTNPKAREAFQVLSKALSDLSLPEMRSKYKNVIDVARKRLQRDRAKENKKRMKRNQDLLNENPDNFTPDELENICELTLKENKERMEYAEKCRQANESYQKQQEAMKEEEIKAKLDYQREWDESRDFRVDSWRSYKTKLETDKSSIRLNYFKESLTKRH